MIPPTQYVTKHKTTIPRNKSRIFFTRNAIRIISTETNIYVNANLITPYRLGNKAKIQDEIAPSIDAKIILICLVFHLKSFLTTFKSMKSTHKFNKNNLSI